MADDNMTLGYLMGQEGNKSGNGMFGSGGIYDLLALALVFGAWGGGGFGFGGGFGGGGAGLQGMATRADVNEAFALNGIENGIRGIQQGICDSTYGLTNTVNSGFNSLSSQLASCCCDNRAATADLKYSIGSEFCALGNAMQSGFRDVVESNNAGTRAIMEKLSQIEYNSLNDKYQAALTENQSLKFAASQAQQNAFITANQEAQTAELIRRIAPMPVPSYTVPAPYPYGYHGGCGCGC